MPNTFTICGSCGELVVNTTGLVLEHIAYPHDGMDGYPEIAYIDVSEWRVTYPGQRLAGIEWDVLDFGGWSENGQYFSPCREAFQED